MPIPVQELERAFLAVDGVTTVAALREQIGALRDGPPRYLVVDLGEGRYSAPLLDDITRAVNRLGPAGLELPLAALPEVAHATGAVQRTAMGFGMASRERDRQATRRLVVLEGDAPVGLLTNEVRGGGANGLMFDLFGRHTTIGNDLLATQLAARQASRTCRFCSGSFTFYEVRPELRAYACPNCHAVLSLDDA